MFNNIIYFIVVLLIFNINYPGDTPANSLPLSMFMLFLSWLVFAGYCRWGFSSLQKQFHKGLTDDSGSTGQYQRMVVKFSVLAIFLFALVTYLLNLKYWLRLIPGFEKFSVLQGVIALSLFMFYLGTIWYFAYPAYKTVFGTEITRESFVRSNTKFNLPILFPWIVLSLVYDLIALSSWAEPGGLLDTVWGQIIFFAVFLTLLMIFLPGFIHYFWGCAPLKASEKGRELEAFLREKNFKYRHLLNWPIFEGKMMTAGFMGIVSRYRYILVTDSLLQVLSLEELKAVLAHEMGHAKYRHLYFYILFFVGFMVISFGLSDVFLYVISAQPFFINMISDTDSKTISLLYLFLSLPMLLTLFVYFRYIMGFFMRNFERQADLYSAKTMGTPMPAISSLEKIALLSGKIRELPSGDILVTTVHGYARFNEDTLTTKLIGEDKVLVGVDDLARMWVFLDGDGSQIYHWDGEGQPVSASEGWLPVEYPEDFANDGVVTDNDGQVWVVIHDTVRVFAEVSSWTTYTLSNLKMEPDPLDLEALTLNLFYLPDVDQMWVASCFTGPIGAWSAFGARWFDGREWHVEDSPVEIGCVQSIHQDAEGNLWMGADDTLWRYTLSTGQWESYPVPSPIEGYYRVVVSYINVSPEGVPWVYFMMCGGACCDEYRLMRLDNDQWVTVSSYYWYTHVVFDPTGTAWLFYPNSIVRYVDGEGSDFGGIFCTDAAISDSKGRVWVVGGDCDRKWGEPGKDWGIWFYESEEY